MDHHYHEELKRLRASAQRATPESDNRRAYQRELRIRVARRILWLTCFLAVLGYVIWMCTL